MSARKVNTLVLAGVLALAGAEGCLPHPPGSVIVVARRPPPPHREGMGPPPGPGYVWIGGYWTWRANTFVWVVGQWVPIPPGHRYWVAGHWVHARRGWYFVEGYWE